MERLKLALAVLLLTAVLGTCGGGPPAPPPAVSVAVAPGTATIHVTRTLQFTATVRNSSNTAVTWSLSGPGCSGAACGTISSAGLYTAPATVPNPATVTVMATSAADTSKSANATITVMETVGITVDPPDASIAVNSTRQFRATVVNAVDSGVTWTVSGSSCTGSACGTIATDGLYTAPSVVPADPAVMITATSVEDAAMSASVTATVKDIANEWTWVSGSDMANQLGSYGTKGVPAASNVPGARVFAVSWLDPGGNLWLFGGYGPGPGLGGIDFNDLWRFDPTAHEWTWVSGSNTGDQSGIYGIKGVAGPLNRPGSKENPLAWSGPSGKLWLFGGMGYDSVGANGAINDLWSFDLATQQWTWVSGSNTTNQLGVYGTKGQADPSNVPGARYRGITWIDADGRLWLFGGWGLASVGSLLYLNDLWMYDPATGEWTWESGSDLAGQAGIYGTKGVPAASNVPGARIDAVSWIDPQGKLWLFGGNALDSTGAYGYMNDLWKYDPATHEWTWISGNDIGNPAGIYGTKGIADLANAPGGRASAVSWVDPAGILWLFGGGERLNDLWQFDPATLKWTWVSGNDTPNGAGLYGMKGFTDPQNVPGARAYALSWIDLSGRMWLSGGGGRDSAGNEGWLNDLWYYIR